jgi:hypothetical protein
MKSSCLVGWLIDWLNLTLDALSMKSSASMQCWRASAEIWQSKSRVGCFWEKRQFFHRKLMKIDKNCDHNIDPSQVNKVANEKCWLKIERVGDGGEKKKKMEKWWHAPVSKIELRYKFSYPDKSFHTQIKVFLPRCLLSTFLASLSAWNRFYKTVSAIIYVKISNCV